MDRDGRRDVWRSVPDSLASIANYLRRHGWRLSQGQGMEVNVSASISCSLEGLRQGNPLREEAQLSLTRMGNTSLPSENDGATTFFAKAVRPPGTYLSCCQRTSMCSSSIMSPTSIHCSSATSLIGCAVVPAFRRYGGEQILRGEVISGPCRSAFRPKAMMSARSMV